MSPRSPTLHRPSLPPHPQERPVTPEVRHAPSVATGIADQPRPPHKPRSTPSSPTPPRVPFLGKTKTTRGCVTVENRGVKEERPRREPRNPARPFLTPGGLGPLLAGGKREVWERGLPRDSTTNLGRCPRQPATEPGRGTSVRTTVEVDIIDIIGSLVRYIHGRGRPGKTRRGNNDGAIGASTGCPWRPSAVHDHAVG